MKSSTLRASKSIQYRSLIRTLTLFVLILCVAASTLLVVLIKSKEYAFERSYPNPTISSTAINTGPPPFPIGVNPRTKTITENPTVDEFVSTTIASNHTDSSLPDSWLERLTAKLALFDWYQNLASPASRVLVIQSGERGEEIVENFGSILKWSAEERMEFYTRIASSTPELRDGKFYPGSYLSAKDASPEDVAELITERFNTEVKARYPKNIETIVPLTDALIIASLLEREAYDFEDMRYISGILWNRLFIDMKLQIDATLQYAKGSRASEPWWPVPVPADKFISSPYNTYQNKGLPPNPIANPSVDAIIATLNPRETDCLFYFHDSDGGFHCTKTYEDHVALLKKHYGRGR